MDFDISKIRIIAHGNDLEKISKELPFLEGFEFDGIVGFIADYSRINHSFGNGHLPRVFLSAYNEKYSTFELPNSMKGNPIIDSHEVRFYVNDNFEYVVMKS